MAFFPIAISTDNRASKGIPPLMLRNCFVEPQPEGTGKAAPVSIRPSMGLTARVTPSSGKVLRGVFSQSGVVNGGLFVVAGGTLYSVSTSWVATAIGTIAGTTNAVLMKGLGTKLIILADGILYEYDGTTLTPNNDEDFPFNASTLEVLADRVLTNALDSDTFDWSAVASEGGALVWPATGFAASARNPDPIVAQVVVGGDLWHFGKTSTQVWRAMGGLDSEAFDVLGAIVIDKGIIGRDAIAKLDSSVMWVGDDRVVYALNGYAPVRLTNRDVEDALAALTDAQAAQIKCFSYAQGSHLTWVLRPPVGRAFAYDTLTQRWHERTTWQQDMFLPCYYANFNGVHVVASDASDVLYTWDENVYADASVPQERVMMLHIPFAARTICRSLCLDMKTYGQPMTGQGSDPTARVTYYADGGSRDSIAERGLEREVRLGASGDFKMRPMIWRLGMFNAADGMLVKIVITDPVGFAMTGVWVNERPI